MTFAKEAWPLVAVILAAALAAGLLRKPAISIAIVGLALAILMFFRIPSRDTSAPSDAVLAPANGKITKIGLVRDPEFAPGEYHHVVTFLSVFNVHVQRAPVTGEVVGSTLRRGRRVAAFRDDAGDINERHLTVFELENGQNVAMAQIAGLVARRVVSYLDVGDRVERGELVGVIKFGSRVDLFVPSHYRLLVGEGETVNEGETPVAIDELDEAA